MSRLLAVARLELRESARRPLFWIWLALVALLSWGLSEGSVRIETGDSTVGGTKAFLTSQFAVARVLAVTMPLLYAFFVAVAAGMSVIRDEELGVGPLLHATSLRPREYVFGRFLAAAAAVAFVLASHLVLFALFHHLSPGAEAKEFIGPFRPKSYLVPAAVFAVPALTFFAGASFWLGERTRRPVTVFLLPIALLGASVFFVWSYTPAGMDPRLDRALMALDPSGYRWLQRTWLDVDRGVDFYNHQPIGFDAWFLVSRVAFVALGLVAVVHSARHFERTLRGRAGVRTSARRPASDIAPDLGPAAPPRLDPVSVRPPGVLAGAWHVLRAELRELRHQPGLYLFVPLIVLQVLGQAQTARGAFDTPVIVTSGTLAVGSFGSLTALTCLLLLFYLVECLRREQTSGAAPLVLATSIQNASLLFGKLAAAWVVAGALLAAALAGAALSIATTGEAPFELRPFALVWGALLMPTLILWCAFVAAVWSLVRSRTSTYGIGLAAIVWTVYGLVTGEMSWRWNWPLWGALRWTDLGTFELDRAPLVWNRALALAAALLFIAVALRHAPRREADPTWTLVRLRPREWRRGALRLAPFAALTLVCWVVLDRGVERGFQGEHAEKAYKDYWRRNVATWTDHDDPDIARVEVDLALFPERREIEVEGFFELVNANEGPLARFALTPGRHWRDAVWTLDGEAAEPEDRAGLAVFTPPDPLAPGGRTTVGFRHRARVPDGWTRNGGGAGEFVLPAGIVLTSLSPSFVPVVGYLERVGLDEENSYDAREWPEDFFEGTTRSFISGHAPFPVELRVSAPASYTINSVGRLVSDTLADGRRTSVWRSDHPVHFFNVVAGRWDVRRGDGVAVFHHPDHTANLDTIVSTLEAARARYSEWFHPFPWEELKLSEFPALADYAQGFATNIPFAESLGFLTRPDEKADAAFVVTAHEAAHQWWANLLCPGEGPGGNVLSEGMAHYSTILLYDSERGVGERIEFCKRIEERYGEQRSEDSERPLAWLDGTRPGDTTATYDKGGFVFWMLTHLMGRERTLAGLQAFIEHYRENRDHPVLQDFVRHMRGFAPDERAFDAFADQWFFDVVLPELRFEDVSLEHAGDGEAWEVRARVRNAGTGEVPVEIAASRGVRFPPESDRERKHANGEALAASEDAYEEARTILTLGPGDERDVILRTSFVPQRLVADPDALVLQLLRERAVHDL